MLGALTACSAGPVAIEPIDLAPADREICRQLRDELPGRVLGQEPRAVSPEDVVTTAAAWGDPAIVLRCGVPRPAALKRSSPCLEIEEVGWFTEERPDGYVFTTIGRPTYVEVRVPGAYAPESGALVDLGRAVKAIVPVDEPCS